MNIILRDLSFSYASKIRERKIFSDVNFTFEAGKFYSIMGPSGTGKTTFFKLLSQDIKPTCGKIFFDNTDASTLKPQYIRSQIISQIYQEYMLVPYLTAQENILLYREILGFKTTVEEKHNVDHLLSLVGIEEFKDTPVQLLSGGEQQRVCIARSLASNAPILLADEPTGALDQENTAKIALLLREIAHKQDMTVLAATHDPIVAKRADEQCVIDNYCLRFVGDPH